MAFIKTWDEAAPVGTDYIRSGDDEIRDFKYAIRERLAVDHKFLATESGTDVGYHKWMTLIEVADIGTGASGVPILGAQTVNGKPELVYTDEDDNDVQITDAGSAKGPFVTGDWIVSSVATAHAGWTDVSATYSNKFMRINATPLTTGGADTHTTPSHTLTAAEMPAHTHVYSAPWGGSSAGGGEAGDAYLNPAATTASTGGGGGHVHAAADNVPAYVQVVIFQKD